jgi:hypothetical protein
VRRGELLLEDLGCADVYSGGGTPAHFALAVPDGIHGNMDPDPIAVPTQASFVEAILWNFAAQKTPVFGVAALAVVGMRQLQKRYAASRQLCSL